MWVHHLGPTRIRDFKVQEWNDGVTEGDVVVVKLCKGSVRLVKKEEHVRSSSDNASLFNHFIESPCQSKTKRLSIPTAHMTRRRRCRCRRGTA
ncbi:hypothetical protein IRJ41_024802 [Triplophysa rosa]|uniref:Uncharacterized protein n=1 Tax=Triplophysa rosa TaxID=992332 RepID=A0A9W7W7W1_TRIRA|nr:hypothetical protein IRJ41_024802 [Triplophysa rosa]